MAKTIAQFARGRKPKPAPAAAPAANPPARSGNLAKPAAKVDGRRKPKVRTTQFNTKVSPEWLARFQARLDAEADRRAELGVAGRFSRPDFLQLLLGYFEKGEGLEMSPFGLSSVSDKAVDLLAEHWKLPKDKAIENALLQVVKDLKLAKRI